MIAFALDEEQHVEAFLRKAFDVLPMYFDDYEVVFVNDGSTDQTPNIVDQLAEEFPQLVVVHHDVNRGIGEAIHTARKHVSKDYVFWSDIDAHFDLRDLNKILPLLVEYDVVSAFKHENIKSKTPFSMFKSRVNYYIIKILFLSPIKDFQFVQFFPREFFCEGIELESCSSFIPPECLIKANLVDLSVYQVQIKYHSYLALERPSKCMNTKTIFKSLGDIFSFWFRWVFLGGKQRALKTWRHSSASNCEWRKNKVVKDEQR